MKVNGTRIRNELGIYKVATKSIFTAYVVKGIENFNLKTVYMASVRSQGAGSNGWFYDNYEEAQNEALELLEECYNKLMEDVEKYE